MQPSQCSAAHSNLVQAGTHRGLAGGGKKLLLAGSSQQGSTPGKGVRGGLRWETNEMGLVYLWLCHFKERLSLKSKCVFFPDFFQVNIAKINVSDPNNLPEAKKNQQKKNSGMAFTQIIVINEILLRLK